VEVITSSFFGSFCVKEVFYPWLKRGKKHMLFVEPASNLDSAKSEFPLDYPAKHLVTVRPIHVDPFNPRKVGLISCRK
jgi:hypothetical protein